MDISKIRKLQLQSAKNRKKVLEMVQAAQSGHLGGSFSVMDILTVLYFDKMSVNPEEAGMKDRDRLVLSKGHCSPALYAVLAARGFFPEQELMGFRNINSNLSGHVEMTKVPGVDMSAGSLGQGLSAAIGMALVGKTEKRNFRVFAVLGDGEIQEGQIWEGAMAAGNYQLGNLTVFIDNNKLQIDGRVEEVMSPYPIEEKMQAFKWNVITIDGHSIEEIANAVDRADKMTDKPTVIIAETVKGKGISFMENNVKYHGSLPTPEQFECGFQELNARIDILEEQVWA